MSEKKELPTVGEPERPDRCETCRYWREETDSDDTEAHKRWGSCQRFPPTVPTEGMNRATGLGIFPATIVKDWCGEWRAKDGRRRVDLAEAPELLESLDADAILERLNRIDRERNALIVLRRAALRNEKPER